MAIDVASIRSESTINGESFSLGVMGIATMWKSSTTTSSGER